MRVDDAPAVLLERWRADIAALAPDAGSARHEAAGAALVSGWSEPHRHYHTLTHLAEMFGALDDLVAAGELDDGSARVARVAAWYHDLVYDPRAPAGQNEERSAALAREQLSRLGVDSPVVATVNSLIALTADHQGEPPLTADGTGRHTAAARAAFHDADLWILAAPEGRFDEYCGQVRVEYAHVPDRLYARARTAILDSLVGRGPVYRTAHGGRAWQAAAEANVARERARLGV